MKMATPALVVCMGLILSGGYWRWCVFTLCPAVVLRTKSASSEPVSCRKRVRMMRVWMNDDKVAFSVRQTGIPAKPAFGFVGKGGVAERVRPDV